MNNETMDTTTGVLRNSNGHFQPGSRSLGGRAPKAFEKGIKDALQAKWPPEIIAERIEAAYALAEKQGSARGMLAAIELAAAYLYGKPTITIAAQSANTDLLQRLLESKEPLFPEPEDTLLLTGNN